MYQIVWNGRCSKWSSSVCFVRKRHETQIPCRPNPLHVKFSPRLSVSQRVFCFVHAHAVTPHQLKLRRVARLLQFNRFKLCIALVLIGFPKSYLLLLLPTDRLSILAIKAKLVFIVAKVARDLIVLLFYGDDHDWADQCAEQVRYFKEEWRHEVAYDQRPTAHDNHETVGRQSECARDHASDFIIAVPLGSACLLVACIAIVKGKTERVIDHS